jgi:hypothetical protein
MREMEVKERRGEERRRDRRVEEWRGGSCCWEGKGRGAEGQNASVEARRERQTERISEEPSTYQPLILPSMMARLSGVWESWHSGESRTDLGLESGSPHLSRVIYLPLLTPTAMILT